MTRLLADPVEARGAECRGVYTGKPSLERSSSGEHLPLQPRLECCAHPCYSLGDMVLTPRPRSPFSHLTVIPAPEPEYRGGAATCPPRSIPPRWAKARACPTPDTQIGGEYAKPGPPATCPISLTSRNSCVQFHLVSVSIHLVSVSFHLVSVAPPAREWHRMTQNDPLFAEKLAHGLPKALPHLL